MIRDLSYGSQGSDVVEVQKALNRRMAAGLVLDGDFGNNTRGALLAFQKRYNLEPDGIVGSQTRSVLFPLAGITFHLVGSYVRADVPVASMRRFGSPVAKIPVRAQTTAVRSPALRSVSFRPEVGLFGATISGDIPGSDPLPPPLPSILQNLPFGQSTGPTDTLTLPAGSFPVPPLLTRLLPIPGLKLDSQQVQPGVQFNFAPLFQSSPGSPNPSGQAILAFQSVMARNKDQPGHLEVAEGFQLGAPFFANSSDGMVWTMQWFAQFTWADPFWQVGRWHFVSPFAQVSAGLDLKQGNTTLGLGLFPANIQFDVVKDKVSLFAQGGLVGSWDLAQKRVEMGPAAIFGANITVGSF
ncbi:MAG TPA: peptidoglycan-binding domain-containing protein [Bryobacteraceae bacterium]|nr:peptidoglycan-binding domain-containing protein [Bryobacteraceae bacterium]